MVNSRPKSCAPSVILKKPKGINQPGGKNSLNLVTLSLTSVINSASALERVQLFLMSFLGPVSGLPDFY
jgi:hypothetical protein